MCFDISDTNACMYICMYICMYVFMYVCILSSPGSVSGVGQGYILYLPIKRCVCVCVYVFAFGLIFMFYTFKFLCCHLLVLD
jgi:hypothetical protein